MDELFHYRNKAQFPVGRNKEGKIVTGFYAGRTHNIIENRDCALGVSENKEGTGPCDRTYGESTGLSHIMRQQARAGEPYSDPLRVFHERSDGLSDSERKQAHERGAAGEISA